MRYKHLYKSGFHRSKMYEAPLQISLQIAYQNIVDTETILCYYFRGNKKRCCSMPQEEKLLSLFKELYEKQDAIAKYHQDPSLHEYSFSDLHCIDAVGSLERPNVTNIAASLNMTRGAVSKITKRLTAKKLLLPYSLEGNKKEVCFSLTEEGKKQEQKQLMDLATVTAT